MESTEIKKDDDNKTDENKKTFLKSENEKYVFKVGKSICKIKSENSDDNKIKIGFLIKLNKKDGPFYCLLTNEHIINENSIKTNEKIEINYDYENEKRIIILNDKERYIYEYNENDIYINIIEIINKDNINEDFFLLPDINDNISSVEDIYIPQFINENKPSYTEGKILRIEKNKIIYKTNITTEKSGMPILNKITNNVLGIHKQKSQDKEEESYGNIINQIVDIFKNKFIYKTSQYEGEYFQDKFEGKGKYIYDNGKYYIGEWKNGLRNGKGIYYYKNGNIKNNGELFSDKFVGKR